MTTPHAARPESGPSQGVTAGISVVVPAYKSGASLPLLVQRLEPVLESLADEFELIVIDDASQDDTWSVIEELVEKYAWVRGVELTRNFGQHSALLCGIREVRFGTVVTMDDDLQHPPESLPELIAALQDDVDVVYGAPRTAAHGLSRNLASQVTKLALRHAIGVEMARHVSAWRVFRCDLRRAFAKFGGPFVSIDVLLTWATTRFAVVFVPHDARRFGRSNYTFGHLVRHSLNMMTGFSVLPLQFATWVGFGMALFGVGILAYVVGNWFLRGSLPGFPFLASIIAILSGAQLLTLGIIGEYLARMHFRLMDKPSYAVRRIYSGRAGPTS